MNPLTFRAFLYKNNTVIFGLKRGNIPERASEIHLRRDLKFSIGVFNMNSRNIVTIALLSISALLTGCKGQLEGTVIENAQYISTDAQGNVTHEGYTDATGSFSYKKGDTVAFYVGDILLGSIRPRICV